MMVPLKAKGKGAAAPSFARAMWLQSFSAKGRGKFLRYNRFLGQSAAARRRFCGVPRISSGAFQRQGSLQGHFEEVG